MRLTIAAAIVLLTYGPSTARPSARVSLAIARMIAQTHYEPAPPSVRHSDGSWSMGLHGVTEYKFRAVRTLIGPHPKHDILIKHAGAALVPTIEHFILVKSDDGTTVGEDVSWMRRGLCVSDHWVAENHLEAEVTALQASYLCTDR